MGEPLIRKILIPNRGEIAVRIARTCREMEIDTVLAHAEGDASTPAIRTFDQLVSLGEGDSRQTYLDVAKIIDAARRIGADAIHPGYGFLSERAALADACADAGIVFIGPDGESIRKMGSKADARRIMQDAGVPIVPGYDGDDQTDARLLSEGTSIGMPLLVKASSGGGGKGMKIVHDPAELPAAIDAARREALKSFGDDHLILEKFIEEPRHVEIQILGDHHGQILHLFERDCSIQRRHQKIVEESPAPRFSEELRSTMCEAALQAARAVSYRNAGTVEFILTPAGEFYFLEMNTRLQVEHPVTEAVLGIDLVRAQIEVARGAPLRWKQADLKQRGHAIECRIYAEDPAEGFLPQTGTVHRYREPAGPGIRVDSGIDQGSEVTVGFDPMLSKVICWAETRDDCIDRLEQALRNYVILGTLTNVSYLRQLISHPAFRSGEVGTHFIEKHGDSLRQERSPHAAAVAAVLAAAGRRSGKSSAGKPEVAATVWDTVGSWGRT